MFPLKDDIPTRRFAILTLAIVVINVAMFFGFQDAKISFSGGQVNDEKTIEYGAIPYEITHPGKECVDATKAPPELQQVAVAANSPLVCEGQEIDAGATRIRVTDNLPKSITGEQAPWWVTVFTSMFMHGGLLHIGGNMLFLWIFGNNIEDSMSRWRFPVFYLLSGIVALIAQTLIEPNAAVPTIGASGAVAGVLGGYALLYPRARVTTLVFIIIFFTILNLPALWVLGLWFLLQVAYGAAELGQPLGGSGGVAYFAHIGGFLFGLLIIRLFANEVHEDYERPRRLPVY